MTSSPSLSLPSLPSFSLSLLLLLLRFPSSPLAPKPRFLSLFSVSFSASSDDGTPGGETRCLEGTNQEPSPSEAPEKEEAAPSSPRSSPSPLRGFLLRVCRLCVVAVVVAVVSGLPLLLSSSLTSSSPSL